MQPLARTAQLEPPADSCWGASVCAALQPKTRPRPSQSDDFGSFGRRIVLSKLHWLCFFSLAILYLPSQRHRCRRRRRRRRHLEANKGRRWAAEDGEEDEGEKRSKSGGFGSDVIALGSTWLGGEQLAELGPLLVDVRGPSGRNEVTTWPAYVWRAAFVFAISCLVLEQRERERERDLEGVALEGKGHGGDANREPAGHLLPSGPRSRDGQSTRSLSLSITPRTSRPWGRSPSRTRSLQVPVDPISGRQRLTLRLASWAGGRGGLSDEQVARPWLSKEINRRKADRMHQSMQRRRIEDGNRWFGSVRFGSVRGGS